MTLTKNASIYRKVIYSFFLFIISIQFVYADDLDVSREKAKSTYFTGNLELSLPLFLSLSETGDAESQYYVGLIYLTEGWAGRNIEKAMAYLNTAADQNYAEAMWKIGEAYENGWGFEKNLLTALDWYRKSKWSDVAKSRIRFIKLKNGDAVLQSNSEAIQALVHDAEKNNAESEFKLGKIYDEGKLAERNVEKAHFWYKKAAINNHSYSMLMMGYFLCRGIGVEIDKVKANDWLNKSGRNAHCN